MSGIYIPGMGMPNECRECALETDYGTCGYYSLYVEAGHDSELGKRRDDCPLVPVPEHGRLIDADAFYKSIKRWLVKFYGAYEKDKKDERIAALLELDLAVRAILEDAPTIIPGEERS